MFYIAWLINNIGKIFRQNTTRLEMHVLIYERNSRKKFVKKNPEKF